MISSSPNFQKKVFRILWRNDNSYGIDPQILGHGVQEFCAIEEGLIELFYEDDIK